MDETPLSHEELDTPEMRKKIAVAKARIEQTREDEQRQAEEDASYEPELDTHGPYGECDCARHRKEYAALVPGLRFNLREWRDRARDMERERDSIIAERDRYEKALEEIVEAVYEGTGLTSDEMRFAARTALQPEEPR